MGPSLARHFLFPEGEFLLLFTSSPPHSGFRFQPLRFLFTFSLLLILSLYMKPTPAPKTLHYRVQGKGHFPADMLRYDSASAVEGDIHSRDYRIITINAKRCTPDRWASFGWNVMISDKAS